jgi:hypothetical protein
MPVERERHARILCRIWDDDDWKARSPRGQWFYMLLLSQASLNRAGVIDLTSKRWARLASGPAVEQQIASAMDELEAANFIVVDRDTEELFVRSYMRGDGVEKQPNVLKAACRQALEVHSSTIRVALEAEMRRLERPRREESAACLDAAIDALAKGNGNPSPNPSPKGSNNGSPKGMGHPRGVGEGESLVGKGSSSVVGSVGSPRSQAKRGSRLPKDFAATPEMLEWSRANTPDVNVERSTASNGYGRGASRTATSRKPTRTSRRSSAPTSNPT